MVEIDREIFFRCYHEEFGSLIQSQVDGINITLALMEQNPWPNDFFAAYFLATFKHECADTWWPIEERGPKRYFDKYEPRTSIGRVLGNIKPGDGYLFRARGQIGLTGRRNYEWAAEVTGFPLISYPDGMKWPALGYQVAQEGLITGGFTGVALARYCDLSQPDYYNARKCVNALDQAQAIARYAEKFERILSVRCSKSPDQMP